MMQLAFGRIESGLNWELRGDRTWSNEDIRALARALIVAADKLQEDPSAVDKILELKDGNIPN